MVYIKLVLLLKRFTAPGASERKSMSTIHMFPVNESDFCTSEIDSNGLLHTMHREPTRTSTRSILLMSSMAALIKRTCQLARYEGVLRRFGFESLGRLIIVLVFVWRSIAIVAALSRTLSFGTSCSHSLRSRRFRSRPLGGPCSASKRYLRG
jgi:hypothetical protein